MLVSRSILLVYLIAMMSAPRPAVGGCPQWISDVVGGQHRKRSVAQNDIAHWLGILPLGVTSAPQAIEDTDHLVVAKLESGFQQTAMIQFEGVSKKLMARAWVEGELGGVPLENFSDSILQLMAAIPAVDSEQVKVVRTVYTHILLPGYANDFTVSEHRLFLSLKAVLEMSGFTHADLVPEVLFLNKNKQLSKKSYRLPANLSWRANDYSPGRATRRHFESLQRP